MRLGVKFSWGLSLEISVSTENKIQFVWKFVGLVFFPLKILPVPSSKLVILALVFSSPVLGLLADSSDKMPNDQGKSVRWPLLSFPLFCDLLLLAFCCSCFFFFSPKNRYFVLKTTYLLAKVELSPCLWHLGYLKSWGST